MNSSLPFQGILIVLFFVFYQQKINANTLALTQINTDIIQTERSDSNQTMILTTNTKEIKKKKKQWLSRPWQAFITSMIVPGAGQLIYAGGFYKGASFGGRGYIRAPIYWGILTLYAIGIYQNYTDFEATNFAYNSYTKMQNFKDSTDFKSINPILSKIPQSTLKNLKSEYRKQLDENLVYFILVWVIQAIDAAVFTHLRNFDVSDNLSMGIQIAPSPSVMASSSFLSNVNPLYTIQPKLTISFNSSRRHYAHTR